MGGPGFPGPGFPGPGASPSLRNEKAGNEISLKFHFFAGIRPIRPQIRNPRDKLCRTQIVSSKSDGFVAIFCDVHLSGGGRKMKFLWGVGGIPPRNFIKMKFSRVLVQVLQEWAIPRPGARADDPDPGPRAPGPGPPNPKPPAPGIAHSCRTCTRTLENFILMKFLAGMPPTPHRISFSCHLPKIENRRKCTKIHRI